MSLFRRRPAVGSPAGTLEKPFEPAASTVEHVPASGAHASAGVCGVVATADRWPVPGAVVTVLGATGQQLGRAVAEETGAFEIPVAAAGPVTVVIAAAGVDPQARAVLVQPRQLADLGVIRVGSVRQARLPGPSRWTIDPVHSIVRATARHLALSRVDGRFTGFEGTIQVTDPIEHSTVDVRIDAASIYTGNPDRDTHLRSADFLDVVRFPHLTYRGDSVRRESDTRWRIDGRLTIRDVTRRVPLDVTYLGSGPDPWGGTRMALTATASLARRDFEITWNMGLPGGLVVIGPTLLVELDIQAVSIPGP